MGYKFLPKNAYEERIVRGLFTSKQELEEMILEFEKENLFKSVSRKSVKNMKEAAHKPLNKAMNTEI